MITALEGTARSLVFGRTTFVPVDQTLVDDALGATQRLIVAPDHTQWSLVRPHEEESDVGLVYREGKNGSDHKYFFHYAHDLTTIAWSAGLNVHAVKAELDVLARLYSELNRMALTIGASLEEEFPGIFRGQLVSELKRSMTESHPFGTTTLRGLFYPTDENQKGAKTHLDRSLFTIHLGDEGGALWAARDEADTGGRIISPPKGSALVFCGVKVLALTRGRVRPLWHRSSVEVGKDRKALVHFVHVPTEVPVRDARTEFLAHEAKKR